MKEEQTEAGSTMYRVAEIGSRMYCVADQSEHRGEPCTLMEVVDDGSDDVLVWKVRVRFDDGDEETVYVYELYERMVHAKVTIDIILADELDYQDWLHELKRSEDSPTPISVEIREEVVEQTAPASER